MSTFEVARQEDTQCLLRPADQEFTVDLGGFYFTSLDL
jgi:hypothetical protein